MIQKYTTNKTYVIPGILSISILICICALTCNGIPVCGSKDIKNSCFDLFGCIPFIDSL